MGTERSHASYSMVYILALPSQPVSLALHQGREHILILVIDWGDTISVTVKNSLPNNGTGVHWHGIRMLNNCPNDGVPGITECPLAPGDTKTYTFKATQHGTTWYHSHFSNQYGDGAFGPLVINGPASANYDIDLGPLVINDYYYLTAWQIGLQSHANLQNGAPPPPADTIMINGKNKNKANTAGSYSNTKIKKGKKYRLRLINTSVDNNIRVSLDNHPFQIITSDLVPIKPIISNWILLAIGQRYDVIFTANQTEGNYWFRAEVVTACASSNNFNGRSIFTYDTVSVADPTSSAYTQPDGCAEMSPLVPWVANTVGSSADFKSQAGNLQVNLAQQGLTTNGQNIVVWGINLTAIDVTWEKPTLQYVKDKNTSYPKTFSLLELPNEGIWSYWIIQETPGTPVPIPHPIHLHGHDFYVLGQGTGTFDINSSPNSLKYDNPPRRDTALLPGGGWLALAFPTDNPGAWLVSTPSPFLFEYMTCDANKHRCIATSRGMFRTVSRCSSSKPRIRHRWVMPTGITLARNGTHMSRTRSIQRSTLACRVAIRPSSHSCRFVLLLLHRHTIKPHHRRLLHSSSWGAYFRFGSWVHGGCRRASLCIASWP
jgi:FtsP/CotA-like multicopper oxidase with cupredoxin domain